MDKLVFVVILAASLVTAWWSRGGKRHDEIHDYFVASRQFGGILLFFLAVGETYSLGVLTAFPGGIYLHGTPFCIWFIGYVVLAFPVGYFLAPLIWQAARRYDPVTVADLFRRHFNSRVLEILVSLIAILFMIPWGIIQFMGLTMVLQGLGFTLPAWVLMTAGALLAYTYTAMSGIRAPAYVSVIKDTLLLAAIIVVGIAVFRLPHGYRTALRGIDEPVFTGRDIRMMTTNILFQASGLFLFPAAIASFFTARSPQTIRRAMIAMPLYMVMFAFLILTAFYARGAFGPGLSPNHIFIDTARRILSPWLIGVVAGGAALSGLVVLASTCLVIGPLLTHNLLKGLTEKQQKSGAQFISVVYLIASMLGATFAASIAATMNNLTYFGLTQFLPGILIIGLNLTAPARAVAAGLITGVVIPSVLFLSGVDTGGINPGLIGLAFNALIVVTLTIYSRHGMSDNGLAGTRR
ncbi:sodium:solute symporter family protein [Acetobacter oeni]|uniref:Sodium:solute symporter n=1 Tax=Acetobacter oeni TaxID=304077 RepID=A0A511XNC3_9PROT|nr:sodium:solute symporter family protein [Acetobacter oeni]MBB3884256.1 SSS family solute:Na+ symporter [Acetobacter oeni]NHO20225.1 sodium:solute symporter family protein [Acetobacter oeni]GBR06285.1 Na+/solute symporter [Acetobacter oeni LMG 21952]GEN64425.1 sodium:solute symporter [Acetobacter oeni]